ncbi:DUF4381 domain-containing protein [Marinomonas agarivorans]|nr:DUF4381 domain-containing protein [Marinomonas agarivorans]
MAALFLTAFFSFVTLLFSIALHANTITLPNKNYILPDSIPMWPPVWWSWLIVLFIIIGLTVLGLYWFIGYRKNAYRREAIRLVTRLKEEHTQLSDAEFLTQCHQIIRRCLITRGRKDLAALPSQDLFAELDASLTVERRFNQLGTVFLTGAYQPNLSLSSEVKQKVLVTIKYWCRRHNV